MTKYYKITFNLATYNIEEFKKHLKLLRWLGIAGASRIIGIKDPVDEIEKKDEFLFDGDGSDKLRNIKIEEISEKKYIKAIKREKNED